jgi:hypothetical protein
MNRALDITAYAISGILVIAGLANIVTFSVFGLMLGFALLGVGTLILQVTRLHATNTAQVAALELLLQRQQRSALKTNRAD